MERAGAWLTASRIGRPSELFRPDANFEARSAWRHLDVSRAQLEPVFGAGDESRSLKRELREPRATFTAHPNDHARRAAPHSVAGGFEAPGYKLTDPLGNWSGRRRHRLRHQLGQCVCRRFAEPGLLQRETQQLRPLVLCEEGRRYSTRVGRAPDADRAVGLLLDGDVGAGGDGLTA